MCVIILEMKSVLMGIRKTTTTSFLCKSHVFCHHSSVVEQGISNAQVGSSSLSGGIGQISEWLKEGDCKSSGSAFVGSNPTLPILL